MLLCILLLLALLLLLLQTQAVQNFARKKIVAYLEQKLHTQLAIAQQYIDSIVKNPSLAKIVEQQFIVGSSYTYNYNQLAGSNRRTGIYFNGLLDIAGNIAGLLNGSNWKNNEVGTLFGVKYAQFAKAEIDLRYYKQVNRSSQWVNRLILGFGYPYGNSRQLPFVKQFFPGATTVSGVFAAVPLARGVTPRPTSTTQRRCFYPISRATSSWSSILNTAPSCSASSKALYLSMLEMFGC